MTLTPSTVLVAVVATLVIVYLFRKWRAAVDRAIRLDVDKDLLSKRALAGEQQAATLAAARAELQTQLEAERARLQDLLTRVRPYLQVADATDEAKRIKDEVSQEATFARNALEGEIRAARKELRDEITAKRADIDQKVVDAGHQAAKIVDDATKRAEDIAGDAYKALKNADQIKRVVDAMQNKIEGYGDRYIVPTYSLLDKLAENYGFAEAGKELKKARERSELLVEQGRAATCDYVEESRRETAIRFVLDAFNGKVDSILSLTKAENFGTLKQKIVDAWALVNHNGEAFRSARITEDYLQARIEELKWGCTTAELRDRDREEQRRIRDQMREEERAQREFERAQRDAEKEEQAIRKAMERLQGMVEKATAEQREKYEGELALMRTKLAEAEAKNQKALSMAQQTKSGHVYVISNIGSFGESVFKIGMTRRLEPLDRIRELGDASVPFPFDVHSMMYTTDAPKLEHALHRSFLTSQVNKVNPRKEFFRVQLSDIKSAVEAMGIQCAWTLAAQAAEFRESQAVEAAIAADVGAKQRWEKEQLLEHPRAFGADEADEEPRVTLPSAA